MSVWGRISRMTWKNVVKEFVPPIVMRALRPAPTVGADTVYASAPATIAAAQAAGLSVCAYVERLWGGPGRSASLIDKLHGLGAISLESKTIVEIGPGTGRYIEHTLKRCRPKRYQIYETDSAWSSWLAKRYAVEACAADGQSLESTESNSSDLIHAYGVFVYLPFMISYRYFKEIARVAAPGAAAQRAPEVTQTRHRLQGLSQHANPSRTSQTDPAPRPYTVLLIAGSCALSSGPAIGCPVHH
jgi:hypothetical protein